MSFVGGIGSGKKKLLHQCRKIPRIGWSIHLGPEGEKARIRRWIQGRWSQDDLAEEVGHPFQRSQCWGPRRIEGFSGRSYRSRVRFTFFLDRGLSSSGTLSHQSVSKFCSIELLELSSSSLYVAEQSAREDNCFVQRCSTLRSETDVVSDLSNFTLLLPCVLSSLAPLKVIQSEKRQKHERTHLPSFQFPPTDTNQITISRTKHIICSIATPFNSCFLVVI